MKRELISFRMASTSSLKVDVENRVIKDVIMTQAAKEAGGHGFGIEAEFVEKMVEFATGKLKNRVPANFGHNWDNMGKQLGYFTNIRMEGEKALGDLHIFSSADISPVLPNMGEWLLSLSQEDNSRLNASIKFSVDFYYQLDKAGNKYKVWYWDDKEGWISPSKALGSIFAAFKDLISTDIVEKGAVTDRLFSEDTLYQRFQDIIAEPGFTEMLAENEENFPQLTDHFMQKGNHGIFQALKRFFTKQNTIMAENQNEPVVQETTEQRFERLENLIQELSARITPPADPEPALPAQETNFAEQIAALQAELAELKKAPAAEHTAGVTTETDETPAFMDLDIHEKARAFKN